MFWHSLDLAGQSHSDYLSCLGCLSMHVAVSSVWRTCTCSPPLFSIRSSQAQLCRIYATHLQISTSRNSKWLWSNEGFSYVSSGCHQWTSVCKPVFYLSTHCSPNWVDRVDQAALVKQSQRQGLYLCMSHWIARWVFVTTTLSCRWGPHRLDHRL